MTTVTEDLIGGTVNQSLTSGFTASRIFFIDGVQGNANAVQFQAIQNGQIPNVGNAHPTIPGIIVDTINAVNAPKSKRQVKVTVNYKTVQSGGSSSPDEPAQTQIVISGTVQTVQTNKHFVNNEEKLIILKYTYPDGEAPDGVDKEKEIVATIDKQIPLIVATLSRLETGDPAQKARDFVGKLNSRTFIGSQKHFWMCTKIGGPSNDGGFTFMVTYEFIRKSGGWNTDVAFTDERTGKIPVDIEDQAAALINVRTQRTADFGRLDLGPFSR